MRTQTYHAVEEIAAERERQIDEEGYTTSHDDQYGDGQLARAAACYAAASDEARPEQVPPGWPWAREWWKPRTRRENLVRAGALIVAELERLERIGQ